jgi:hypothetical protein
MSKATKKFTVVVLKPGQRVPGRLTGANSHLLVIDAVDIDSAINAARKLHPKGTVLSAALWLPRAP